MQSPGSSSTLDQRDADFIIWLNSHCRSGYVAAFRQLARTPNIIWCEAEDLIAIFSALRPCERGGGETTDVEELLSLLTISK